MLIMVAGIWGVYRSVKTGESVTPWPMGPVSREKNRVLWWFDLSTYCVLIILGAFVSFKLLS